jgi:tellurium resistance protein TerD
MKWIKVDTSKKGYSVGKAALGGLLLGPIGLVGGALGKKKSAYCCGNCGFSHEYDG